jgi:hypothetical protein
MSATIWRCSCLVKEDGRVLYLAVLDRILSGCEEDRVLGAVAAGDDVRLLIVGARQEVCANGIVGGPPSTVSMPSFAKAWAEMMTSPPPPPESRSEPP